MENTGQGCKQRAVITPPSGSKKPSTSHSEEPYCGSAHQPPGSVHHGHRYIRPSEGNQARMNRAADAQTQGKHSPRTCGEKE